MSKLYNKILLASIVILSGSLVLETRVVAEVSAPSDTQAANSTAQSVPLTAERYGCFSGYRERTYQGERPLSRYEFAAGLNSCLNQVNQLINSNTSDRVTQEELAVPKRQLETLKSELERLRMRVDSLDSEN
jgi:transposase-like protein